MGTDDADRGAQCERQANSALEPTSIASNSDEETVTSQDPLQGSNSFLGASGHRSQEDDVPPIRPVKSNYGLPFIDYGLSSIGTRIGHTSLCAAFGAGVLVCIACFSAAAGHSSQLRSPVATPASTKTMPVGHTLLPAAPVLAAWPADELFLNAEVHEVITENLMQVGQSLFVHSERDTVRQVVAATFRNASDELAKRAPVVTKQLSAIKLKEFEKNAVLSWLRLMSVPEVRSLGFTVALAMHSTTSSDRQTVRQHIESTLRPHLGGIEKLRDEVVPGSLFKLWFEEHDWEMTLDRENVRVMEASEGGELYEGSTGKIPKVADKRHAITGGALEAVRALVDAIKLCARRSKKPLEFPLWITSLAASLGMGGDLLSCELQEQGSSPFSLAAEIEFTQALFCPLKYGNQGIDALRAISDMMRPSVPRGPPARREMDIVTASPVPNPAFGVKPIGGVGGSSGTVELAPPELQTPASIASAAMPTKSHTPVSAVITKEAKRPTLALASI